MSIAKVVEVLAKRASVLDPSQPAVIEAAERVQGIEPVHAVLASTIRARRTPLGPSRSSVGKE